MRYKASSLLHKVGFFSISWVMFQYFTCFFSNRFPKLERCEKWTYQACRQGHLDLVNLLVQSLGRKTKMTSCSVFKCFLMFVVLVLFVVFFLQFAKDVFFQ